MRQNAQNRKKAYKMKSAAAIIGAIGVVVLLAVGGWFLYWKLFASSTTRTAQIYQTQYGAQSAYIEQVNNIIPQIANLQTTMVAPSTPKSEISALRSQVTTLTTQACGLVAEITNQPSNIASWSNLNCG